MEPGVLQKLEREYTLSQINWKRSLTDVDMKRRKVAEREKSRLHIDVIKQLSSPTLKFEVKHFQLFGGLKKIDTEVHNTIPSRETVLAENNYIQFERMRKLQPHAARYNNFYGCIQGEANKPRTPQSRTATASIQEGLRSKPQSLRSQSVHGLHSKPQSLRSQSVQGSLTPLSMRSSPGMPKFP